MKTFKELMSEQEIGTSTPFICPNTMQNQFGPFQPNDKLNPTEKKKISKKVVTEDEGGDGGVTNTVGSGNIAGCPTPAQLASDPHAFTPPTKKKIKLTDLVSRTPPNNIS